MSAQKDRLPDFRSQTSFLGLGRDLKAYDERGPLDNHVVISLAQHLGDRSPSNYSYLGASRQKSVVAYLDGLQGNAAAYQSSKRS